MIARHATILERHHLTRLRAFPTWLGLCGGCGVVVEGQGPADAHARHLRDVRSQS